MPRRISFPSCLPSLETIRLIVLAATAYAFCAYWPGEASAAAKILKFGYILSSDSQLGAGEKVFAAEIAARTGGRYIVEDYPDAMLGGEVAMINDVQLGALDLAFITGAPLSNLLPEAGVFNIPFLFRNIEEARAVLDGPIGDEYIEKLNKQGLTALAWGENGMRHLTNSKRPVRRPEDIAGLKLRLPQSDIMAVGFNALDAKVQQIAFPQVYGALRDGSVDGQENPIATILASKFYEVQTYLSLTGHIYDPAVIFISDDCFNVLSSADKTAFREAAKLAARESRRVVSEKERTGIAVLKTKGMSIVETIDREAFAKRIATAEPSFEKAFGRDAIERIKAAALASDRATPSQASQ